MLTVNDLMTVNPKVVALDTPLAEVLQLMQEEGCRHLPVVDGRDLVGIITDRDVRVQLNSPLLRQSVAIRLEDVAGLTAASCMTQDPMTISPDALIQSAAEMMSLYKFGCLPVVDGRALVGIITEVDLLDYLAQLPVTYG